MYFSPCSGTHGPQNPLRKPLGAWADRAHPKTPMSLPPPSPESYRASKRAAPGAPLRSGENSLLPEAGPQSETQNSCDRLLEIDESLVNSFQVGSAGLRPSDLPCAWTGKRLCAPALRDPRSLPYRVKKPEWRHRAAQPKMAALRGAPRTCVASPRFQSPTDPKFCEGGGRDLLCSPNSPVSLELCLAQRRSWINARGMNDCGMSPLTWVQILLCDMRFEPL